MKRQIAITLGLIALVFWPLAVSATNFLTYHFDNARDGANTNETILTPANVNTNQFFKFFTYTVDAEIYAEPLYMAHVTITGQGFHDVLFVATENDTVYAFDADNNLGTNGGLLWKTNLGTAATSVLFGTRYHHNVLNPLLGITGTPVIDPVSGTLYVDALTTPVGGTTNAQHHVHALNIADGTERPYSPVLVAASVPGTGADSSNGVVVFNANQEDSRPALTLAGGVLYVGFGSFGDTDVYHGWVIGFNATNLVPITNDAFASTPNATVGAFGVNAGEGAIWGGGAGLCVDASTNLYFETGNGSFSAWTNGGDYGDSFVKLSITNGFTVSDYFSPSNQASMDVNDLDLGSGGSMLLPDSAGSAAHPHLILGAGKEGTVYLLDRDHMGHFGTTNNLVQELFEVINGGSYGTPAYFNHWVYYQGAGDVLKAFAITNAVMTNIPVSQSTVSIGSLGYSPTVSANGTSNAIVWVVDSSAYNNTSSDTGSGAAVLRAFNATNLAQQLYTSSQRAGDKAPGTVKYPVATVADGKVFVAGDYGVAVYGVGIILPPPIISPNGGVYTNSVSVTLSDATNTTSIYYTLDGTTPSTGSTLYTGPFTLTNTVVVNAIAAQPGAFNSAVANASFINSSSVGGGTGLLGAYWTNTTSIAFTNLPFTTPPTLVRTDATVNFTWGTSGPAPNIGGTNYVVRWTGSVQPQFSGLYTFYTTADAGVRLFVNGQLLINDWVNQAATTLSNSITLTAQQLYNVELDYFYQNSNSAQVSLSWSSPSTAPAVIPQSQLYPYTNPPPSVVIETPANGATYAAAASVTMGVEADTPYNPISHVDFYANGGLFGSLASSPNAPLYTLTTTGLLPNPGGETANSPPVSATPAASATTLLTTTNVQAQGADWTAAIWKTNGGGTAVSPVAGNNYATVFNGTSIGNGLNNTRIRSSPSATTQTFAGNMLTMYTNTELRIKDSPAVLNFPGVNGNPGLVLNGGMLNMGVDGSAVITGAVQVASQSYNSCDGNNGGGGGLTGTIRTIGIAANLSGTGNMVLINCITNLPETISGASNTFSGQWIVQCGWLQGISTNSLGTNSITVDPNYTGYLSAMPNATSPAGPALFEVNYNLTSAGTLTLANGGLMNLHQNCTFAAVNIQGTLLAPGTYTYSQLVSQFPNNFLPGGSGSITVNPVMYATPSPVATPTGLTATPGNGIVTLVWNAVVGAANYNVKRLGVNGAYTTIATVSGATTTYTDTGLANGTPYTYEVSALSAPGYILTAVATDGSGLSSTSAPVQISVNAGSGLPYGLTANSTVSPCLNMPNVVPAVFPGTLPTTLSGTGAFSNTTNRTPAAGLIPYAPNTPLWSDGAAKSRYLALPNNGGLITPDEQIAFQTTNTWTFPAGTVFVKNFDLAVNQTNPAVPLRRLETRLLVRDINGGVYGVTYKWRPDNSDADLLVTSSNEVVLITNSAGVTAQTWYYPSPVDCLSCHTPVANYVLGLNTRQLNGSLTYPATGNTDNQLRTLNRLGFFNPAFNEANISGYSQLASLTNTSAPIEQRARSYLDANCAQCHQPGGLGITFDARYDTPLASQYITNYPAQLTLGFDNACIVKGGDIWRSMIYQRMNTTDPSSKMPTLARNLVDTNAIAVMTAWINSLPGLPALAPPLITPNGGSFMPSVSVTVQPQNVGASIYYTLNGTLPTTNSSLYTGAINLTSNAVLSANAFQTGWYNSIAASAMFAIQPFQLATSGFSSNNQFVLQVPANVGSNYVLLTTTNFITWTPLLTNQATNTPLYLTAPNATNSPYRFYRVVQQ